MTFNEILEREYRREFCEFIQFDRGASRSIARRAAREVAASTVIYRLPYRRKIAAHIRAAKYWAANRD